MNLLKLIASILIIASIGACQDKLNITVDGIVTNEISGKPIPNAEVLVHCWYISSFDDGSIDRQTLLTDEHGKFHANFIRGYEVDVAAKQEGYNASKSYNELISNNVFVNLKLSESKENLTLKTLFNTDYSHLDMADSIPFLRIRIPSVKDSNEDSIKHDLNRIETFGFDLSTMTTSSDTSKCDFWYKIENKAAQPTTIIANTNGGIIPIYSNFIRSSLLFEFNIAPTSGYTNELKLNRKEEGFFVLCRDGKTYGKIIWEKSEVDAGVPDGKDGSFREYGKYFICFYQPDGSTDLSYSSPDINLENFLIDRRLR